MGPQLTPDGLPYGPIKYKEIVRERYYITKHTHTSYADIGKMTPIERQYLIEFINEDIKKKNDYINEIANKK